MVLGLLDQLEIFWQLYQIELLGLLTGLNGMNGIEIIEWVGVKSALCIHSLPTASGVQMPSKCYLDITQKPNVICKENFAQILIGLSSLVGQHPMKSLLSICLSLQLSIYLKIGSLLFSDIVLDQGFPQFLPEILKYWVGVQWGQSSLMGRRCLFSLGWPPF